MKFREMIGAGPDETLEGLYVEMALDGVFVRRAQDDKLVVRFQNAAMTFYDPDEVDIYTITESNLSALHDAALDLMLKLAWDDDNIGEDVKDAIHMAHAVMASMGELSNGEES